MQLWQSIVISTVMSWFGFFFLKPALKFFLYPLLNSTLLAANKNHRKSELYVLKSESSASTLAIPYSGKLRIPSIQKV